MNLFTRVKVLCFLVVTISGCKTAKSTSESKSDVGLHYSPRGEQEVNLYLFKVPNLPLICRGLCGIDPASIPDLAARRQACSKENFLITLDDLVSMPVPDEYTGLMKEIIDELKNEKDRGLKSFIARREFDSLVKLISQRISEKGVKGGCTAWVNSEAQAQKPVVTDEPDANSKCRNYSNLKYCINDKVYHKDGGYGPILGFFPNGTVSWKNVANSNRNLTSSQQLLGVTNGCVNYNQIKYCVGDSVVHVNGGSGKIVAVYGDGQIGWVNRENNDYFVLSVPSYLAVR